MSSVKCGCNRRGFLRRLCVAAGLLPIGLGAREKKGPVKESARALADTRPTTVFLCGDVMTGRAVDQILPHPNTPELYEPYIRDARAYIELAERESGPIPRPADFAYIWGDALAEWRRAAPDLRIVNLETAVTESAEPWPGKGIHYRMHPKNAPCLTAAGIDCCVLANNHVLDWGYAGLEETLETLRAAGIRTAGAGLDLAQAQAPAVLEIPGNGRVLVFAFGHGSSGIPWRWGAGRNQPGVNRLEDLSDRAADRIAEQVHTRKRAGDIVVASIHWGGNWGYEIPSEQRRFAHRLIDLGSFDLVHGHSSHHPKAIEVYRNRAILYGCGDFFNDYEGIGGKEEYRGDLALMYFPTIDPATGKLVRFAMTSTRTERFRVTRASAGDARWMRDVLTREAGRFGTGVSLDDDNRLSLTWQSE
ncbi:MAG: CapA family protein [Pseudomonadota bacterium]|nr:CapA family protein [Pseudomonadota bacterium]